MSRQSDPKFELTATDVIILAILLLIFGSYFFNSCGIATSMVGAG